ncbi:MAG: hypothetical protein L6R38_008094 [Xanthoria sp. 2 TBL-2021]|nr:MAG: hypothetical protein L6R38_008094 [Xanthoria sp. 2 TBL-2021]
MFLRPFVIREGGPVMGDNVHYPPKLWHGCPLAAFARAFHSLGTQSHLFGVEDKQQLRHLKDLYGIHDQLAGTTPSPHSRRRQSTTPQHNIITAYPPTPQADYHTVHAAQTLHSSPEIDAGVATPPAQSQERPATRKEAPAYTVVGREP